MRSLRIMASIRQSSHRRMAPASTDRLVRLFACVAFENIIVLKDMTEEIGRQPQTVMVTYQLRGGREAVEIFRSE